MREPKTPFGGCAGRCRLNYPRMPFRLSMRGYADVPGATDMNPCAFHMGQGLSLFRIRKTHIPVFSGIRKGWPPAENSVRSLVSLPNKSSPQKLFFARFGAQGHFFYIWRTVGKAPETARFMHEAPAGIRKASGMSGPACFYGQSFRMLFRRGMGKALCALTGWRTWLGRVLHRAAQPRLGCIFCWQIQM